MSDSTIPQLFNPDAEEALVGAVLINPDQYADLAARVKPGDFKTIRLGWIWKAFATLRAAGLDIDYISTVEALERSGKLEEAGGDSYVTTLCARVPSSTSADSYARIVRDLAARRRKLEKANEAAREAYDFTVQPEEITIGSRPRYVIRAAREALQPQLPISWIVDGIIGQGSITVFYGEPGAKKTYSLLSMAVCVATGKPWVDHKTTAGKVLIIDEESGERRLALRLAAALRGEMAGDDTPLQYISLAAFHLDDPADVVLVESLISETGAKLVIIDALAEIMTGDENSKEDTQPVLIAVRKLAENTGAAICIIHHSNKMGGYRGSSAIKGAVDLLVQVDSKDGSDFINFKSEKNRDGQKLEWSARANWSKDPESFFLLAADAPKKARTNSKAEDYVIRYFTEHPNATVKDCEDNADSCSPGTAKNTLYNLAGRGLIQRTNTGKVATYALASVTSNGSVTDE